jgi:nicotinamidase-related amidase
MTRKSPAVLVVIDVQKAFDLGGWGSRNNPQAEARIAELLRAWRAAGWPVIHVHHVNPAHGSRFNPGGPGIQPKEEVLPVPGELIVQKSVNSAFIGTDLEARLRALGSPALVIVGLTTDHCVSTTVRMAGNFGFETYLVSDATATFERTGPNGRHYTADEMHDTALTSLHEEFATVVDTRGALDLLQGSAAPGAQAGQH